MDRADRHLVVLAELLDGVDLLAQRVDADHHLDRVVAQRRRPAEGVGGRLGVDRGGGEGDQWGRGHGSARPGHDRDLVEALEDDALAQRPRADLQLARSKMSMQASATSAPGRSGASGSARRPAGRRAPRATCPSAWGSSRTASRARARAAPAARPRSARRRRCVRATGTSWRWRPPGPARRVAAGARRRGRSRRGSACAGRGSRRPTDAAPEPRPGHPGRTERERPGHVGVLVGAAGDLERPAADVEDGEPARRPAEPAAYGQEGQPGLVLAREHLERDATVLLDVLEHLVGVDGIADR